MANALTKNSQGNYQYAYAGLGALSGFATATSPNNGHSIGHWEGKTLGVDTVGFSGRSSFPGGVNASEQAHMVERLLADHPDHIIDFGASQSVYDDEAELGSENWSCENAAGCEACGFEGAVKDFEPPATGNVVNIHSRMRKSQ